METQTFMRNFTIQNKLGFIIILFLGMIFLILNINSFSIFENYFGVSKKERKYQEKKFNRMNLKLLTPTKTTTTTRKIGIRDKPIIFVGGVPRSGTTLMRVMFDSHPEISCGKETRIIPRIFSMRNQWKDSEFEKERLKMAGMTDEIIDSAIGAFVYQVIAKHGKYAKNLCNKDPLVFQHLSYVKKVFPNAKFILMIRDGRAVAHSIITRKVSVPGFNLTSYRGCLSKWSNMIKSMYNMCVDIGTKNCLPVFYEKLILNPEKTMKSVFNFLNIKWNDAVLNHEKFIGKKISLAEYEKSTNQVIKPIYLEALNSWVGKIPKHLLDQMDNIAPMLRTLGYNPFDNPPNYGDADKKIKENTLKIDSLIPVNNILAKNDSKLINNIV